MSDENEIKNDAETKIESGELPEIDDSVVGQEEKQLEAATTEQASEDLGLIMDVPLRLSVELGSASLPVRDVLALSKGSVVELDRTNGEPADVYVNDRLIARGELTVQEDRVAVRITELIAVKSTNAR
jgi:flagellar motor switch protein FliN/FliY